MNMMMIRTLPIAHIPPSGHCCCDDPCSPQPESHCQTYLAEQTRIEQFFWAPLFPRPAVPIRCAPLTNWG